MPKSYESILGTKPLMCSWEYLVDTQLATPPFSNVGRFSSYYEHFNTYDVVIKKKKQQMYRIME